ncbi:hypothetical protein KUH03_30515 [Sphingobacterium sp. E70]|uniref:hypothetical protein n=1 Tax=Sphingobacterium sp. E70 TaxID=2853439 RepID=UPI00211BA762|nr:hypothetical protein [Sphingobacterium sp. E70]ULT23481.1 hypothetical protein KUH03_30515 [Sphingobacterium sp. E70]
MHILFEYVDLQRKDHPIALLQRLLQQREEGLLITFFSTDRQGNKKEPVYLLKI